MPTTKTNQCAVCKTPIWSSSTHCRKHGQSTAKARQAADRLRGVPHLHQRKSGNSVVWVNGNRQFNPEYGRRYRAENRVLVKFWKRQRNYREKNAVGSHTFYEWERLKAQYNWRCPMCGLREAEITLTEDHIIPLSQGGSNNIENIQPLCKSCNSKKHVKTIRFLPLSLN